MILSKDYVTVRQLDIYANYTQCYLCVDEFLDGDTAAYLTIDMLKKILPYINYENDEYALSLNEDLSILHLHHFNELGKPAEIISRIQAIDVDTNETIEVFKVYLSWMIIEPYDVAIYKCAVATQLIKELIYT